MQRLGKLLSPLSLAPAAVQDTVVRAKANFALFVTTTDPLVALTRVRNWS